MQQLLSCSGKYSGQNAELPALLTITFGQFFHFDNLGLFLMLNLEILFRNIQSVDVVNKIFLV